MLVDLRPKGVKGNDDREGARPRAHHLQQERHPLRPEKPTVTSGVRLGTPAGTTRGFGAGRVPPRSARLIVEVVDGLAASGDDGNAAVEAAVKARVEALCDRFPVYPGV